MGSRLRFQRGAALALFPAVFLGTGYRPIGVPNISRDQSLTRIGQVSPYPPGHSVTGQGEIWEITLAAAKSGTNT